MAFIDTVKVTEEFLSILLYLDIRRRNHNLYWDLPLNLAQDKHDVHICNP
jgi:hypothetical protein